jgi:hypothetical protein
LRLFALLIHDYERRTVPPIEPDPIEAILFRMDQMDLTRKDMIPCLGSESKVSEVFSGKRRLDDPEAAQGAWHSRGSADQGAERKGILRGRTGSLCYQMK